MEFPIQTTIYKLILGAMLFLNALVLLGLSGIILLPILLVSLVVLVWCVRNIASPPRFMWIEEDTLVICDKLKNQYYQRIPIEQIQSASVRDAVDTSGALHGVGFYKKLIFILENGEKSFDIPFHCSDKYAQEMVTAIKRLRT